MQALTGSRARTAAILAVLTAIGAETIFFVPMHIPLGNVLTQLIPGIAAGLTAVSLVIIYRTIRVINFAQLALGAVAAQLFYEFYTRHILPFPIAILAGVVAGTIVALVIGIISASLFFRHPRLVMTVVTILFVQLVGAFTGPISNAFRRDELVTRHPPVIGPFPNDTISISGLPFRVAHLVALVMLVGAAATLVFFFRRTRVGTAIRASAENADRASLLGINVKLLQVGIWALVGFLASIASIAVQPVQQYQASGITDQVGLLLPLAAAVLGRMTSMPVAFFSAIA